MWNAGLKELSYHYSYSRILQSDRNLTTHFDSVVSNGDCLNMINAFKIQNKHGFMYILKSVILYNPEILPFSIFEGCEFHTVCQ